MNRYSREDFVEAHWCGVDGSTYFCPGCNASKEDAELPSVGCPCEHFGSGDGSLPAAGVERYLARAVPVSENTE